MKTRERAEARRLRREEGRSIREIEELLGVARSTASLWVRDIPLTVAQRSALTLRNPVYNGQFKGAATNAARSRCRRRVYQERGRMRAKKPDALYVAGCMLYWAEGDNGRNAVRLANSDPAVISHFVKFLRAEFRVADEQIRVTCNLFADHENRKTEVEDFWLTTLRLPRACLCTSIVNRYSRYSQKKRRNKLPYGTCRVAVHSTEIVQTIYGSIQELGGFDRPEWLDLP
jgi:hypothetical protein